MTVLSATSSAELINSSTEKIIQYISTPMDNIKVNQSIYKGASVKPKMAETFALNNTEENVLDLIGDGHMSLESAGKRKPKRKLPVNME